jgi:hypothetical protein
MPKPEEDPAIQEQNRAIEAELAATHEAAAQLAHQLTELRRENATLVRRRATADHLLASLGNLQRQMASSLAESARDAEALGLDLSVIVQVRINDQPVQDLTTAINQRVSQIATEIDDEVEGSLAERHGAIQEEIVVLEARLTAPQQEYQKYLKQVSEWEQTRAQIVGSEDLPGSIRHIEFQRNQLRTVPERIRRLERQRDRKALEIYAEKQRLRRHYETYHQPVEDFLEKHPLAGQGFQLTFRTSVREADFGSRFLAMVNQRRIGPFSGVDEGSEALHGLIAEVNWSSARSVLRFARSILAEMHSHQGKELSLKDQLVQDATLDDVLNFIFGFEYLEPIYQLKWDGKTVDELSPGERGTLLLIFYFLIDREDIPLIIDQPEENLDNQTVVRTLVPCVKDAKERRQIVIVTHNPNLAVVCDADQVVYAEMHKDLGNEIRYESGSIEDPTINRRILDVLEGTRPAFDQRDARYLD